MPRCVFKLLWDTLGEGQEIFAYVLNMAKNGDHYCQMTVDNLEASAKAFSFRRSLPGESLEAYRAALVAHVDRQDMAAAHEIRVGRQQRDWTQADIEAFTQHTATLPGPSSTLHQQAFVTRIEEGPFEVSEQGLRKVALQGVENMMAMRRKEPTTNLMVMASVLLVNGKILTAFVHSEDRLSFVKSMAQTEPVYGYFIVFDGWLHRVVDSTGGQKAATKVDCIFGHVGSRDVRYSILRPYHARNGKAVFDAPLADLEQVDISNDPYAEIFVTVAAPSRVQ